MKISSNFIRSIKLRCISTKPVYQRPTSIFINSKEYATDDKTNIPLKVIAKIGSNLHTSKYHPINLVRMKIQNHFHTQHTNNRGNASFAAIDSLNPVVSIKQNFDELLIPLSHVSRSPSDTYYINKDLVLRTHTSAHESDLIRSGLNQFLVFGDCYRRDVVNATHYPVFHQAEGVKLFTPDQLFQERGPDSTDLKVFNDNGASTRTDFAQECHTTDTVTILEHSLKLTLRNLVTDIFGADLEMRWVPAYFPFTHPSWELEIFYRNEWLEVLGCGVLEQDILRNAGAGDRVGWAFGLGLERLAMRLYGIPDIRLFWSSDAGFHAQFAGADYTTQITYKPISHYPPCINDISFWIPCGFAPTDFYDLVRTVAGDLAEHVNLIDEFTNKAGRTSHCYRVAYRSMDRNLTQAEVNEVHGLLEKEAAEMLGVEVR